MKLFVSFSRNAVNVDQLSVMLATYGLCSDTARKWMTTTLRRWALENAPATVVEKLEDTAPAWAKKAVAEGSLYRIDLRATERLLDPLIDWLRYMDAEKKPYSQMAAVEAFRQSQAWHEKLAAVEKIGSAEDGLDRVHSYADGYSWVRIHGKRSLNREGNLMGHCVGSYYDQVKAEKCVIYSLRDAKNDPHVTVEVRNTRVTQIKGRANEDVVSKYHKYCIDFLGFMGFNSVNLDGLDVLEDKVIAAYRKYGTHAEVERKVVNVGSFTISYEVPSTPTFDEVLKVYAVKNGGYDKTYRDDGETLWRETSSGSAAVLLSRQDVDAYLALVEANLITLATKPAQVGRTSPDVLKYLRYKLQSHVEVTKLGDLTAVDYSGFSWAFNSVTAVIHKNRTTLLSAYVQTPLYSKAQVTLDLRNKEVLDYVPEIKTLLSKLIASYENLTVDNLGFKSLTPLNREFGELLRSRRTRKKPLVTLRQTEPLVLEQALRDRAFSKSLKAFIETYPHAKITLRSLLDFREVKSVEAFKTFAKSNDIALSGDTSKLFRAFLGLGLLKDKQIALACLLSSKSLTKLFLSWATSPQSLRFGPWYLDHEDRSAADVALLKVQASLPRMFPFTATQLTALGVAGPKLKKLNDLYSYASLSRRISVSMPDTFEPPSAEFFPSRFKLYDTVRVSVANVKLPAIIIGVAFTAGKVMYTLAVPDDGILPTCEEEMPTTGCLVNSLIIAADDRKCFTRMLNVDSVLVHPYAGGD